MYNPKPNFYANLHTHSVHSDGGYSPKQLVLAAKNEGYGALALTDHDTPTGYKEIKEECEKVGMECIFGVEFTAPSKLIGGEHFHITAFNFDYENPKMKKYLADMALRETDQTRVLFERGVRLGKIKGIEWDEVLEYNKGIAWLCNEHLFKVMVEKGVIKKEEYPKFFDELFGVHRDEVPPCREFMEEHEIIELIREAGGIAILAHPLNKLQYLDALIEMGLEGVEVWHPEVDIETQKKAYELAIEKNLYISGGSDHNGLCSGYYERCADPKASPCYAPPMSSGTTKEYFEEIKNMRLER